MNGLLIWYLGGALLVGVITARVVSRLNGGDPPSAAIRSAATAAMAALWPLMLLGLAQWLLIRTTARACAGARPASRELTLAGRD